MNVALICSNYLPLNDQTTKGTEIFVYSYIQTLAKHAQEKDIHITVFASNDSILPVPIQTLEHTPTSRDPDIEKAGKHVQFELALISQALVQQDQFDLYHIHIGDGDLVMPFAPFIHKPLLITLHHLHNADFTRYYFSLFQAWSHVHFVSASNAQRAILPNAHYIETVYHGVDTQTFVFHLEGGERMMWAGRAIPEKGADMAVRVAQHTRHALNLYAITRREHEPWFTSTVRSPVKEHPNDLSLQMDRPRSDLISSFQTSKLYLFPIVKEEAFGLVLIEAMSTGTPIVAFARGSVPEVVKDGETGFLINPSDDDIRGDFIIKETGFAGLCAAVEKIYAMPHEEYRAMRHACRRRVETHFTIDRMVTAYEQIYKKLTC